MNTKIIATLLALLTSAQAMAYDFMENGIAYLINEDNPTTVSVYKERDPIEENDWKSYANISGILTLPETVTHDGVTYTVTAIGLEAFQGCSGITGSLVLPSTINFIDEWAFYGCSGLTGHLVIPNGVTSIGYGAFLDCDGFDEITIPASVQKTAPGAFECRGVQRITSLIADPFLHFGNINPDTFSWQYQGQHYTSCHLRVPAASLDQYMTFEPWKSFPNIDLLENADGKDNVDIEDVNIAINAVLGTLTNADLVANTDVNRDSKTDIEDINLIINAILGVRSDAYNPDITIDLSGYYDVDMQASTYINATSPDVVYTFADRAAHYGNTTQCTNIHFEKIAPGVFYCDDFTGGYHSQIRYPNQTATNMYGYILADEDGNLTMMWSHRDLWYDEILQFSDGHYDKETKRMTYNLTTQYEIMHIELYLP